ncbi:MAG TPA: MFS transporter [Ktedonobacterales bacterium]|jgi:MFS family permease
MDTPMDAGRAPTNAGKATLNAGALVPPLALAQFICSYAATNMNVAINSIATDLGVTVLEIQTAITLFTLVMAALMIPGSKLTDIWGRKFCLMLGLIVYGIGGLMAALAPTIGVMTVGYSFLEGIGSALLIPPVYILITVAFPDIPSRAKAFGIISGAGGIGAAAGPLIGGIVTSAISWRASFGLQVLVVITIIVMARRIADPGIQGARPHFDLEGAVLSAAGLFFVVLGVLQSRTYGWFASREDFKIGDTVIIPKGSISPVWLFVVIGALILMWFFLHIRTAERAGKEPLLSTRLFRNRTSNLGLVTQNMQWLIMQGSFFVISVFLQTVRHYNAIETGLILTPATIGILLASALAGRMAQRRLQKRLIAGGFALAIIGIVLLLLLSDATSSILTFIPGQFLFGVGVGVMLTASVNVVQSSFPDKDQGEISGLSRSVSNLGSSLGTAFVGSVLVSEVVPGNGIYGAALIVMGAFALIGFIAGALLPRHIAGAPQVANAAA